MNKLIESLGGIDQAKKYLKWMKSEGLLMGSYYCEFGRASFYDTTLQKAIEKYNWDNVPENIKYIATNEDGFAFGYEGKPLRGYLHRGFWYGGGESTLILWPYENQFNSTNWRYSLERREN